MRKSEYKYPKLASQTTYQKFLTLKVEELKLLGANLEIKEYPGRPPAWSLEHGGYSGKELKEMKVILVAVKAPGRDGRVSAFNYICNEFYYATVKVSDREGTDVICSCVDSMLEHITEAVAAKTAKRPRT